VDDGIRTRDLHGHNHHATPLAVAAPTSDRMLPIAHTAFLIDDTDTERDRFTTRRRPRER
jgi:hypothetical protein